MQLLSRGFLQRPARPLRDTLVSDTLRFQLDRRTNNTH